MDKVIARKALDIYEGGACNPSGIARTFTDAVDRAREAVGNGTEECRRGEAYAPARIILAQLNWLLGQGIGDYNGFDADFTAVKRAVNGEE